MQRGNKWAAIGVCCVGACFLFVIPIFMSMGAGADFSSVVVIGAMFIYSGIFLFISGLAYFLGHRTQARGVGVKHGTKWAIVSLLFAGALFIFLIIVIASPIDKRAQLRKGYMGVTPLWDYIMLEMFIIALVCLSVSGLMAVLGHKPRPEQRLSRRLALTWAAISMCSSGAFYLSYFTITALDWSPCVRDMLEFASAIIVFSAPCPAFFFAFLALISLKHRPDWKVSAAVAVNAVVLLVIAWFAITDVHHFINRKRYACVASSIAHLRTISSAQELYYRKYSSYGTLSQLSNAPDGEEYGYIDSGLASAIDQEHTKSGYYYLLAVAKDGQLWCCITRPSEWGFTGMRNFFIDQSGEIRFNKTEGSSKWESFK